MKAYLLHDTTCEIRLVHNLYHLFFLTGRARPCSTYNNTRIQAKLNGHSPVEHRQMAA
ncbi:IS3 family transposase [Weissella paramesenteroides]|uniref:IS3 family transposase n=1 Tax=Weissella paramesenteroides TaxID=1249 RepID=UPI0035C968B3